MTIIRNLSFGIKKRNKERIDFELENGIRRAAHGFAEVNGTKNAIFEIYYTIFQKKNMKKIMVLP